MNKTELINAMAEKAGLTKADAHKALNAFVDVVKDELKEDNKVAILGFGTFSVSERKARTGINPKLKTKIEIPAKKVAKFKAGRGII